MERWYPLRLDDNVVRSVASFTFFSAILMLLEPVSRWIILPLFLDFLLRSIHPKLSPLAQLNIFINQQVLKNTPRPVFAPPKRFAMFIGLFLTGVMSISQYLGMEGFFTVLLYFLIIASGLQSWFDYCLGCEIYDVLIKLGVVGRGKTVDDFSIYLSGLTVSSDSSTALIKDELHDLAMSDGKITEEESRLIDQIVGDLHRYDSLLQEAIADGEISYEEKRLLWHDRDRIVREAYNMANSNGKISKDEENILSLLYDLLQKKAVLT